MSEVNTTTPSSTTPPTEGCIDPQVLGHVLLIGINRPAKRNGWTPPMFRQLAEAYTRLDDDPDLRVGVLHAMGDHFTAGLDLPAVSAYMQRGEKAIPEGLVEPHDYGLPGYRRRTKPMVVAGTGNALLPLLAADEFGSAEAYRLNFVQKVVPAGQELDEALAIAQRIAAQAPRAVVATRLNVLKAIEQGQTAAVADFIPVQKELANSEDAAEGVRAFVERRPAQFSGR